MQLWGTNNVLRAEIAIVDDGSVLPPPVLWQNLEGAKISFKRGALPAVIDMLRNEKPVHLTLNDQMPGFVFIHTGLEPVGEAE